jgi:hypothetical protein
VKKATTATRTGPTLRSIEITGGIMALTGTGVDPIRSWINPNGWAFDMRDENGNSVRVTVTTLALEALGAAELETLQAYRAKIEHLASVKHSAGKIEKNGAVKVTSADVREGGLAA